MTKVFNVNLVKRRVVVLAVAAAVSIGVVPAHAQEQPAEVPTAPAPIETPADSAPAGEQLVPEGVQEATPPAPAPVLPPAPVQEDLTVNPVQPVANGQTVSVDVEHEGKPRRYLLRIPDNYNPDVAAPVLFGFGGWEDSPENFSSYARMWNTGAHGEAIIVYPEGYERGWEAAPYAKTRDGEDIRFTKRILDDIDLDYRVDRSRVYAMGMSNGGGFTSVLGCHAQDTFAAVAMVSGAFYNPVEMNCVDAPMATLIMHGTADKMMTYDGGTRHEAGYLPVRAVLGGYLNRNRCDMTLMSEPAASGSERLNFNGCQQPVELLKVPADHTWFWAPDAANEVWNFLSDKHKYVAPPADAPAPTA